MIVFQKEKDIKKYISDIKGAHKRIGFVPTMGALHEGHLSIIRKSKLETDVTICSIFVNPTQFNNKEDFEKYPVTPADDIEMLVKEHCDILFMPDIAEIYPHHMAFTLNFELGYLDTVMEGKFRPGHFKGVVQVVKRLLDIIRPDIMYLGQKDYQQYKVVEKMIRDLHIPVELRMAPTVRESNGLAMSSRNKRLNWPARERAAMIYKILTHAAGQLSYLSVDSIKQLSLEALRQIPGCEPEYFEIADAATLQLVSSLEENKPVVICTAAWLDGVRLIDNVLVL